ncbi:MAG: YdcF family protein [Hyphomicrobiaceae bacterium]
MFFLVSKVVWFLIQPSTVVVLLMLLGVALGVTSRRRLSRTCLLAGLMGMLVLGLSPIGNLIVSPLERRFPVNPAAAGAFEPTGIIVLGGAEEGGTTRASGMLSFNEAGERLVEGLLLARRFPKAKLVFTGGTGSVIYKRKSAAAEVGRFFERAGISPERIVLEDRSRNTHENAVFTHRLLKPKPGERWLLVTSAFHMPRSMGCFRSAGFEVEAYPVDFRTTGGPELWRLFDSIPEGLRRVDFAVREWLGLVAYYVTGRTRELFPAPRAAAGRVSGGRP